MECRHIDTVRQGDREFCKDCGTFVILGHADAEIYQIERDIMEAVLLANSWSVGHGQTE